MTASKAELRRLVRGLERGLSPAARAESDALLRSRFLACPEFASAKTVLLYVGAGLEPDTRPIIASALAAGKTVALPRITGPGLMEARVVSSTAELVPDRYNIPAPPEGSRLILPEAFDLILVPGVAFTPRGHRLGRGGGYYDRYLPQTRGVKMALARALQLFDALPIEERDIMVDIVITDS